MNKYLTRTILLSVLLNMQMFATTAGNKMPYSLYIKDVKDSFSSEVCLAIAIVLLVGGFGHYLWSNLFSEIAMKAVTIGVVFAFMGFAIPFVQSNFAMSGS